MPKINLTCCGESVELDEFPSNYPSEFMGRCAKCKTVWGIQDLTELSDEFDDADADD